MLLRQSAYHPALKMSTNQQLSSTETLSRSRRSLIRPRHSPRDTTIILALGHPLFKQLHDKVIQSRPFTSFVRGLSHEFPQSIACNRVQKY